MLIRSSICLAVRNPVLIQHGQILRLARILEFLYVAHLAGEKIAKALISLCICAGWSAVLLFACNKVRFYLNEAQVN